MVDDDSKLESVDIFNYLTRVLYNRRSKANPYWSQLLVGGMKEGQGYALYMSYMACVYG